jgi:hypothetical protein
MKLFFSKDIGIVRIESAMVNDYGIALTVGKPQEVMGDENIYIYFHIICFILRIGIMKKKVLPRVL